ncbi:hypothetical protein DERP_001745 [Dermatophagoides pteronyssinus]|uniref:Uncharacterized protein n=1 Tax=Dermatophagoides pteronyssinus TaxID=6956 RepID=A0ABQ8JBD8_DERPT|nr:hypothetical protein DERP_001745 [Dermatophagoides pteronyssinus]
MQTTECSFINKYLIDSFKNFEVNNTNDSLLLDTSLKRKKCFKNVIKELECTFYFMQTKHKILLRSYWMK